MSAANICLVLMLVGNYSRAGAESCGGANILLAQDRRLFVDI